MAILSMPLTQIMMLLVPLILLTLLLSTRILKTIQKYYISILPIPPMPMMMLLLVGTLLIILFGKNPQDIISLNYFEKRSKLNIKKIYTKTLNQYCTKICGRQPFSHLVKNQFKIFFQDSL